MEIPLPAAGARRSSFQVTWLPFFSGGLSRAIVCVCLCVCVCVLARTRAGTNTNVSVHVCLYACVETGLNV